MKKRFFTLLLAVAASVTLWASESGTCGANLTWTLDDKGTLTISGTGKMTEFNYDEAPWLAYEDFIKDVVIESGVTNIGGLYAFAYCFNLTSVSISNTVISIGRYTFDGCNSLSAFHVDASNTAFCDVDGVLYNKDKTILIKYPAAKTENTYSVPNTVTCIDEIAFSHCQNLTSVTLPFGLLEIRNSAFERCENITSLVLPNTLKIIGRYAFEYSGIESINIPASVTSIGEIAFRDCHNLTAINVNANNLNYSSANGVLFNKDKTTLLRYPIGKQGAYVIPNTVTRIEDMAFEGCGNLTSITIPKGVTYIGSSAFSRCCSLENVKIPDGVTEIGNYAFNGCYGLTSIVIPDDVTTIGYAAFDECISLPIVDNVRYAGTYLIEAVDKTLSTYTIREGTKWVGNAAFRNCSNLTSISLPNSITNFGYSPFEGCTSLPVVDNIRYADWFLVEAVDRTQSSYTIKDGTKWISSGAFNSCTDMTSIIIPNSVITLVGTAFWGCSALQTINIPKNTTNIIREDYGIGFLANTTGDGFIEGALVAINVDPENPNYASKDGVLFNKDMSVLLEYPSGRKGAYVVPNTVDSIGNLSFYGCQSITELTIPGNVKKIGFGAFGMTSVSSVSFSDGIVSVGGGAFTDCSNLKSIIIPNSVESIGEGAFSSCIKVEKVVLGAGVKKIGDAAFSLDATVVSSITCLAEKVPSISSKSIKIGYTQWEADNTHPYNYEEIEASELIVYVPAASVEAYREDAKWGEFTILPISAQSVDVEEVKVTPTETSAEIAWPVVSGAYTYELVIKDNSGNIICTLVFDSEGRLKSITFLAPGRNRALKQSQTAGFSFTVNNLNSGSTYTYTLTAKDAGDNILDTENGTFVTQTATSIDNIDSSSLQGGDRGRLILHDGQIFILRDGKTFNAQGVELK